MKPWLDKIKMGWAALSLTCRDASRAQSEQLDHPLPPLKRTGLRLHLLYCGWCRRYGKQLRLLHDDTHAHEETITGTAPETLSAEARERIKQKLRGQK